MIKNFLLAFALGMLPITALAQSTNALPQLTDQQKQAMRATFERYRAQEEQLHQRDALPDPVGPHTRSPP